MLVIYVNIFCKYYRIIHRGDVIVIISLQPKNAPKQHLILLFVFSGFKIRKPITLSLKSMFKPNFHFPTSLLSI